MFLNHYADEWIEQWCADNGWTDLFKERINNYWAFPPGAVMPEPIPRQVLRFIKQEKGLSREERWWSLSAVGVGFISAVSSYMTQCPLPLVAAFAFCAVTVALLEVED